MKFRPHSRRKPRLRLDILFAAALWAAVLALSAVTVSGGGLPGGSVSFAAARPALVDQHFANCAAAHAAGRYSIPRHDPSYRAEMDGDDDGLACEPFRGSRRRF